MKTLLVAILSIALSVAAQFSLKAGMSGFRAKAMESRIVPVKVFPHVLLDKYILLGFALYGLGALVWLSVLSRWDVSKAYPLVGLGIGSTVLIGYLLGERIGPLRVIGVSLICAGVVLLGKS